MARAEFARYVIAGALNTGITYALLLFAMRWLAWSVAYTIVYVIGIALGYWLQSRFVFRVPIRWRAAARFPLVYVAQYLFGLASLWLLVEIIRMRPAWAALLTVIATIPLGFFLSRLFLVAESDRPWP